MKLTLTFLFTFILCVNSYAQSNTSSIFRFLDVTPTAKSTALGGNHTGLYDADFSDLHLNPAYLSTESSGNVSATFINLLADAKMGFSSGAWNVENIGTFGAGIRYVGYGDFDRLDENGNKLGGFSATDLSLTGAYAKEITDKLRAGAGVDLIHSSYHNYNSTAAAVSGGIFYQDTARHFSAGIAIRNLGGQITAYDEEREPLPLDISVGITKKPENFPFQLSLTFKKLNDWDLRKFGETEKPSFLNNLARHIILGGQASFGDNFHLRLGYDQYLHEQTETGKDFDLAGITFGVGLNIRGIYVDLSRKSYSQLGGITQIGIKTQVF